jgi:hypothetical protein
MTRAPREGAIAVKAPALRGLTILAECALVEGTVAAKAGPYVAMMDEVGANVVATRSGNINLNGLAPDGSINNGNPFPYDGFIWPSAGDIVLGPSNDIAAFPGAISGPTSFGSGSSRIEDSASGNFAGLDDNSGGGVHTTFVGVFPGYVVSDSPLGTSTDTWDNAIFAGLVVKPRAYKWTWGSGADQCFTLEVGPVAAIPLRVALPLFAIGLGAMGLLG